MYKKLVASAMIADTSNRGTVLVGYLYFIATVQLPLKGHTIIS